MLLRHIYTCRMKIITIPGYIAAVSTAHPMRIRSQGTGRLRGDPPVDDPAPPKGAWAANRFETLIYARWADSQRGPCPSRTDGRAASIQLPDSSVTSTVRMRSQSRSDRGSSCLWPSPRPWASSWQTTSGPSHEASAGERRGGDSNSRGVAPSSFRGYRLVRARLPRPGEPRGFHVMRVFRPGGGSLSATRSLGPP